MNTKTGKDLGLNIVEVTIPRNDMDIDQSKFEKKEDDKWKLRSFSYKEYT
jgi:hypothetical protein